MAAIKLYCFVAVPKHDGCEFPVLRPRTDGPEVESDRLAGWLPVQAVLRYGALAACDVLCEREEDVVLQGQLVILRLGQMIHLCENRVGVHEYTDRHLNKPGF